jgi:hypothetical protein
MNFATKISLPLAVEDYLPILLFAAGLYFVAKKVSETNSLAGQTAFLGGCLVTLGGLCKATWKLIQALGGPDIPVLNNVLFVFLAAGFILVAWAYYRRNAKALGLLWPLLVSGAVWLVAGYIGFFTTSKAWFFFLLGVTTLGNLALLLQLMANAARQRLWLALALFTINLLVIFALARSADQTVTFQWIKQGITTLAQASFAFASYQLWKAAK